MLEARGRFMQEACEAADGGHGQRDRPGARRRWTEFAAEAGVEVANLNSPEQTVLSASAQARSRRRRWPEAAAPSGRSC